MSESTNGVFRIVLSALQTHQFQKLLDQSKAKTGVEGILCTVTRCYDSASGGSILELQAVRLSRSATAKIQKIISEELGSASDSGEIGKGIESLSLNTNC